MENQTIIISLGMGVDSAAILARWLREPDSRNFDLQNLIVLTSQVGDEFASTGRLMEQHLLPLLREHNIRFVQVARKTGSQRDGIVVLDDSRQPTKVYLDGAYKLSQEMLEAGTIPTSGSGGGMCRKCSLKAKGWVLDTWIEANIQGEFRHVMGFNDDEHKRAEKDTSFTKDKNRRSEYPLIDWGWGRAKCEEYLQTWCGEPWEKSCCGYCPFTTNKDSLPHLLERHVDEPKQTMLTLRMEQSAMAFNHRQMLYSKKSARDTFLESKANRPLVERFDREQENVTWGLYHLRRVYIGTCNAMRNLELIQTGSKDEICRALRLRAKYRGLAIKEQPGGVLRMIVSLKPDDERKKDKSTYPCREEIWVAVPAYAQTKVNGKERNAKGDPTGWYKYWPLAKVVQHGSHPQNRQRSGDHDLKAPLRDASEGGQGGDGERIQESVAGMRPRVPSGPQYESRDVVRASSRRSSLLSWGRGLLLDVLQGL